MLHPINSPSCVNELLQLANLQKNVLEFAAANSTYSDAGLRAFMPNEFVDWIIELKTNGKKGVKKTANQFIQELTDYVAYQPIDKDQILTDFILDQEYYAQIENAAFNFSLLPSKSLAYEKAKNLLILFYDFLGEGYPAALVGHPVGTGSFAKKSVVAGCIEMNPDIEYVCPCCDNAFIDNPQTVNGQGYTLEHYFPKSLYPSICLHPLNLIPMCQVCNHQKGNIDPLSPLPLPVIVQVLYSETFHPFSRPVRNLATLSFLVGNSMEFVAQAPPPAYTNSIEAYRIMYQIPDRWNKNWKRVTNKIDIYLKRTVKRIKGPKIDDQAFDLALQEAITELEENFGKDHLNYPAAKWLAWAKVNQFQDLMQAFVGT